LKCLIFSVGTGHREAIGGGRFNVPSGRRAGTGMHWLMIHSPMSQFSRSSAPMMMRSTSFDHLLPFVLGGIEAISLIEILGHVSPCFFASSTGVAV